VFAVSCRVDRYSRIGPLIQFVPHVRGDGCGISSLLILREGEYSYSYYEGPESII